MKKRIISAIPSCEEMISFIAIKEYFSVDKTAKEAINFFSENLAIEDLYGKRLLKLLFLAELLKGQKTAENRDDRITICDEIVKTATELKNFDGLDITGVFS